MDPSRIVVAHMSGFCVPGSRGSSTGAYGIGCGYGNCSTDGSYCICDEGWAHSSYVLNFPDCWEASYTRPLLLIAHEVTLVLTGLAAFYLVFRATKRIKVMCICTALGCGFGCGVPLFQLYEGYFSIASAVFVALSALFNLAGASLLFVYTFEPLKDIGRLRILRGLNLKHMVFVQSSIFSLLMFCVWIPPYLAALEDDWYEYNQRALVFAWAAGVGVLLFLTIPYLYLFPHFERAMSELAKCDVADPRPQASEVRRANTRRVMRQLRMVKNVVIVCGPVVFLPAIYSTAFFARRMQVPMNALMFFIVVGGASCLPVVNIIFFARMTFFAKSRSGEVGGMMASSTKNKRVRSGADEVYIDMPRTESKRDGDSAESGIARDVPLPPAGFFSAASLSG